MTGRRVVTSTQADDDIVQAVEHLLDAGAYAAATGLINALESAKERIAEFPSIGSTRFALATNIPDLRDVAVRRFPYVVFYTEDEDAVRIHRVLHTSRDIPAVLTDR